MSPGRSTREPIYGSNIVKPKLIRVKIPGFVPLLLNRVCTYYEASRSARKTLSLSSYGQKPIILVRILEFSHELTRRNNRGRRFPLIYTCIAPKKQRMGITLILLLTLFLSVASRSWPYRPSCRSTDTTLTIRLRSLTIESAGSCQC